MERRRFLEGAVLAGLAGPGVARGEAPSATPASGIDQLPLTRTPGRQSGDMLYRSLGRTGVEVSAIGFGGSHFAKKALSEAQSIELVHAAIDRGITFMDNCWDYNEGQSEIRMGKALAQGGRRAK
ncbi:MAG: aldo/keto reductase, partial [Myxococcaceae bacterium]